MLRAAPDPPASSPGLRSPVPQDGALQVRQVEAVGVSKAFLAPRSRSAPGGRGRLAAARAALIDVSFHASAGEVVSLLGPSGCGKTTLLRIIAGLVQPDRGTVRVGGVPVVGPSKDKAMVFQHFGLLPWRNVLDNVAFALELDGVPDSERREIAAHYLRLVGLSGFEGHYPHGLSGGMQQRVGIARALTRKPPLLLMDEPFGALDAQTRELLQEELLNILQQTRNTVLCVTHSISEAVLLSDRVLVFTPAPGRIKREVAIPRAAAGADLRTASERKELERELRELLREDRTDVG